MFRLYVIIGIAGMLVFMALVRFIQKSAMNKPGMSLIEKLLFLANILAVLILAASGFAATVCLQKPMEGYLLLLHVALGEALIVFLAASAFVWAESARLVADDAPFEGCVIRQSWSGLKKLFFWAVLGLGTIAALTIMFSMVPLFGTECLEVLYEAHRICSLLLTMAFMGFIISK